MTTKRKPKRKYLTKQRERRLQKMVMAIAVELAVLEEEADELVDALDEHPEYQAEVHAISALMQMACDDIGETLDNFRS